MPSIVAINSKATMTTQDFFGREFSQESEGSGSGIIISQNGSELLIVTNNHVVEGATAIEIVFSDETKASATVKGSESNADLAVLTVDISSLSKETASTIKVATLGNSGEMVPGEMVIAIGNALGYGQSVTVGYVSAVNREVTIDNQTMTLLQTDAAINPGNSGGALINTSGQVIGINSVKFASEDVEGMGYAIPISDAVPMINELMNREAVAAEDQGFLGIDSSTAQEVNEIYAERFNMPIGVYINDVVAGSPAEAAGLMQGDIITGLDGSKVETIEDLKNALSYKKAGQKVKVKIQVMDGGSYEEKELEVTLGVK
jgi:serine protease Do